MNQVYHSFRFFEEEKTNHKLICIYELKGGIAKDGAKLVTAVACAQVT